MDLLHARPLSDVRKPEDLRKGERRIAALQLQLLRTTGRASRQRLLDEIFRAEEQLAPMTTELFSRSRRSARTALTLREIQAVLRPDELLLEMALAEPASFAIVVSRSSARVQRIAGRSTILGQASALVSAARSGRGVTNEAKALSATILTSIRELSSHRRVIISAEGSLQQVPFELLEHALPSGRRLLDTHVVSYTPSAGILVMLRTRTASPSGMRMAGRRRVSGAGGSRNQRLVPWSVTRGVYDLDAAQLRPLPFATEEAQFVSGVFRGPESQLLVKEAATEAALKAQPLASYRILHLAAHGIMSTKVPARSALVLRPSGVEDGLLQAREILDLRLNATLVTLSACDTSTGADQGQDGVASLVRPFVAAGARAVVANLWAADDTFSAALMREFYRELAGGVDIGESLRRAKLRMIESFGPEALPRLWSGVLAYGDASAVVASNGATTHGGNK